VFFNDYNKLCECYSPTQCIGLHYSIPKEYKNIGYLLWVTFCDFPSIFPKFRE
jgi:hypothetical protein